MKCHVVHLAVLALAGATQAAGATSFSAIAGDPNNGFVPDEFLNVTLTPNTVTVIGTMSDGSLAFNGGLTMGPFGNLYSVVNDSTGAGSLYTIQPDGTFSLVGAAGGLGFGFLGGLTWDPANSLFYAAVIDNQGNTTYSSITTGGVAVSFSQNIGTGFSGLAYDSAIGLFYGIGNDNTGFSTLYDFSLGGSVNPVGALGFGFGALTYDPANNAFWAISPVNNSGSQLYQISPAGAESNPFLTLGDGFVELAAQSSAGVSEPSVLYLTGGGLVGLWLKSKRNRRKNGNT